MVKTIRFKSITKMWIKEYLGLKPNTLRVFDDDTDIRKEILDEFISGRCTMIDVEMINAETQEEFIRRVTDVTKFNGEYIISWLHSFK